MNAKYRLPILVAGFIGLGLLSYKGFIPLAYKAAESGLFLEETDDIGSLDAAKNAFTDNAFKQCNDYIKEEIGDKFTVNFSDAPINSWALGYYEYLVNADVSISDNANPAKSERYACRIKYTKGKDTAEIAEKDNWSILGLSGIAEL